tara:strand:+ start:64 stop:240 length:177 start_codon:yes stop_codon:yes gene_type:complete
LNDIKKIVLVMIKVIGINNWVGIIAEKFSEISVPAMATRLFVETLPRFKLEKGEVDLV